MSIILMDWTSRWSLSKSSLIMVTVTASMKSSPHLSVVENMSLLSFPTEILFEIIRSIGHWDVNSDIKAILRFAMTSKQSWTIAESALGCTFKELLSLERRFVADPMRHYFVTEDLSDQQDTHLWGFGPWGGGVCPDLSYLKLDGSLSWLKHHDPELTIEITQIPTHRSEAIENLIAQAGRHHLQIPPPFLMLLRSRTLKDCFPCFMTDTRLELGGSLIQLPSDTDNNAGGYLIKFLFSEMYGDCVSLYLDPMGQHCVLQSRSDPDDCETDKSWKKFIFSRYSLFLCFSNWALQDPNAFL